MLDVVVPATLDLLPFEADGGDLFDGAKHFVRLACHLDSDSIAGQHDQGVRILHERTSVVLDRGGGRM
jgi:hypothetical protein